MIKLNIEHIAIVIPSYNESRNIQILISRILHIIPKATIIVVDDSSGNEHRDTKNICAKYKKSVLYVSRNKKNGRGSAVLDGMKIILAQTTSKIIVEMDADLAHNPKEIPRLCALIGRYDVVIGSRYMAGSRIIKWTWSRIIQSKIINFFLKYWLGLRLTDYTNGFRAYTRHACQYLVTAPMREKGFIALSEIAYRLSKKGFRITEVPISFTDREYGKSNADLKELFYSLFGVIKLRLYN